MSNRIPDEETVRAVLERAGRAPSLHNSQPWRWHWDGVTLRLYVDTGRLLPATDAFNRQGILACGGLLDHARVAWVAAGWQVRIMCLPEPPDRTHLASFAFRGRREPLEADELLAAAIDTRYTDRSPLAPPDAWEELEPVLRQVCAHRDTHLGILDERHRAELDRISRTTARLRRYDPRYQAELVWWTGSGAYTEAGIPASSLPSSDVSARVPAGRSFPVGGAGVHGGVLGDDRAQVVMLSSRDDTVESVLACGAALSAVLLECTAEGMSTCALTHVTELPSARAMISDLAGDRHPQVLVRIGRTVTPPPPHTPRRAIGEVLEVVSGPRRR